MSPLEVINLIPDKITITKATTPANIKAQLTTLAKTTGMQERVATPS
ncbi:MAG: hypothetical protein V1697_00515 [Candidatus Levyibacteriota bacterium]